MGKRPQWRPALVKPVTRVEPTDGFLAIPRNVAPESGDPIEHLLFALKHEGVDLQILAEALPKIDPTSLLTEAWRLPTGTYIRMACSRILQWKRCCRSLSGRASGSRRFAQRRPARSPRPWCARRRRCPGGLEQLGRDADRNRRRGERERSCSVEGKGPADRNVLLEAAASAAGCVKCGSGRPF